MAGCPGAALHDGFVDCSSSCAAHCTAPATAEEHGQLIRRLLAEAERTWAEQQRQAAEERMAASAHGGRPRIPVAEPAAGPMRGQAKWTA
mmetsp:Transcript_77584/g.175414  ORF Transcript_77584/g.175414 Transcript_77584/m.175414 type:complete len:90 (+) Transcript_77584:1-270(+)